MSSRETIPINVVFADIISEKLSEIASLNARYLNAYICHKKYNYILHIYAEIERIPQSHTLSHMSLYVRARVPRQTSYNWLYGY